MHERLKLDVRILGGLQIARRGYVDVRQACRDHIARSERRLVEAEDAEVLHGGIALAHGDRQRVSAVRHDLTGVELHAPGREQGAQLR